jgi:hypothetical protein
MLNRASVHRQSVEFSRAVDRYDAYGRGQGDLAQFMKSQVVSELGDELLEKARDVPCRQPAPNWQAKTTGGIGMVQRESAEEPKAVVPARAVDTLK